MATVQGKPVQTITIHGREYVAVAERVRLAHAAGGFSMTESQLIQVGERWLCRVTIAVGACTFTGTAEVHLTGAKAGTPDASSPFEVAETSALGRALGFAGYGVLDTIASADEVANTPESAPESTPADRARAIIAENAKKTTHQRVAEAVAGANRPATADQRTRIAKACQLLGRPPIEDIESAAAAESILAVLREEYAERQAANQAAQAS